MIGIEPPAGADQKHHTVVSEESDGEEHDGAENPSGFLEGVGEAQYAGADYGDEDIGEGL